MGKRDLFDVKPPRPFEGRRTQNLPRPRGYKRSIVNNVRIEGKFNETKLSYSEIFLRCYSGILVSRSYIGKDMNHTLARAYSRIEMTRYRCYPV